MLLIVENLLARSRFTMREAATPARTGANYRSPHAS